MNKPLLIVLLLAAAGLLAYVLLRGEVDTRPRMPEPPGDRVESYREHPGGVETDEEPDFHVAVEAKMDGSQDVLEFTITERRGWGGQALFIRFWHRVKDEDTGEWSEDPDFDPVEAMCKEPLRLGEPMVFKTSLTSVEFGKLESGLGESEEWEAEVSRWSAVFKPE